MSTNTDGDRCNVYSTARKFTPPPTRTLDQVDSWIDFCAHEIELPATIWCYPVIGYMPYNDAAVSKAKEDLKIALGALEKALLEKTYLVRNSFANFALWLAETNQNSNHSSVRIMPPQRGDCQASCVLDWLER